MQPLYCCKHPRTDSVQRIKHTPKARKQWPVQFGSPIACDVVQAAPELHSSTDAPLLDLRQRAADNAPPSTPASSEGQRSDWGDQSAGSEDEYSASGSHVSSQGPASRHSDDSLHEAGNSSDGVESPEGLKDFMVSFFTSRRLGAGTSAKVRCAGIFLDPEMASALIPQNDITQSASAAARRWLLCRFAVLPSKHGQSCQSSYTYSASRLSWS